MNKKEQRRGERNEHEPNETNRNEAKVTETCRNELRWTTRHRDEQKWTNMKQRKLKRVCVCVCLGEPRLTEVNRPELSDCEQSGGVP